MHVETRFYGPLRDTVGQNSIRMEFSEEVTLDRLINNLIEQYPSLDEYLIEDNDERSSSLVLMKNGTHVQHLDESNPILNDGDVVTFTTPVAGGDR